MRRSAPEYNTDKIDKFYNWKGVKPPERATHGITEDDIESLLQDNLAQHQCQYVQVGSFIRCDVGGFEHGKQIGTMKRLSPDYVSGEPILVPISFS